MRLIEGDRLFQNKTGINGQKRKNERTPNHRFKQLDLVDQPQILTARDRSATGNEKLS